MAFFSYLDKLAKFLESHAEQSEGYRYIGLSLTLPSIEERSLPTVSFCFLDEVIDFIVVMELEVDSGFKEDPVLAAQMDSLRLMVLAADNRLREGGGYVIKGL